MKANLTMSKLRVLIVDDHALLRTGVRLLIDAQPDMEVVGEANSVMQALEVARQKQPDVICLDLSLPGESGLSLLAKLKQHGLSVKVVILTMHDDPAYFQAAMQAGATAYVVKTAADTELLTAIRAVSSGRVFISMPAQNSSALSSVSESKAADHVPLSDREHQVLLGLAAGHTNKDIGQKLGLSVKTIETYRARLLTKLELRTRPELVRYALENGLLTKPFGCE